ncbi:MAG: Uma2 family endonuclease [Acidimicrobiia bacterium]
MGALDFDDEYVLDPDTLIVPESPAHRAVTELIAAAAIHGFGGRHECYRSMNWYPTDGGNPVAPDILVLSAGVLPTGARSYRQRDVAGPLPEVVLEVPSERDGYGSFRAKLRRFQRLGVPAYIVEVEGELAVRRLDPHDREPVPWEGRPMPELADVSVEIDGEQFVVRTTDGVAARSDQPFAEALAATMQARIDALAAQVRALGGEPTG